MCFFGLCFHLECLQCGFSMSTDPIRHHTTGRDYFDSISSFNRSGEESNGRRTGLLWVQHVVEYLIQVYHTDTKHDIYQSFYEIISAIFFGK